jgi:hypothetical protein
LAPKNAAKGPLKTKDKQINGEGESMNRQTVRTKSYKTILALAGAAIIAAMPVAAEASSILDIQSQYVGTSDGQTFHGSAQGWSLSGTSYGADFSGDFDLTASGLTITGTTIIDNTTVSGTLFTGSDITLITSDTANSFAASYEFSFVTTAGWLANLIPSGSLGRIYISGVDLNETDLEFYGGTADIKAPAPVPEPATMSLMLVGGSALVAFRRRRASANN